MTDQFFNGNVAIAEAQKCGRMLTEKTGAKAIWCIVTKKGFWPPSYYFAGDEAELREDLNRGYRVLLVFAVSRRHTLAKSSGYMPIDPAVAEGLLRKATRRAVRRAG